MRKCHSLAVRTGAVLLAGLLSSCSGSSRTLPIEPTITILGIVQNEQQAKLEAALRPFEERTGIRVIYEGRFDFDTVLFERVVEGHPPDIAMVAQPSVIKELAKSGELIPLTFLNEDLLRKDYADTWLALGQVDNVLYGIWYRASVKSLVWYRPSAFEVNGYDIPDSWQELIALSDKIVADGAAPWCIGLENGGATGWPGTDWVEDILLRTAGPEAYRQWSDRQLAFDSPQVVRAFDEFGKILRSPQYVDGGALGTVTTPFSSASLGLFEEPPSCYMHRQANFISSFFPEDKLPRVDYDVFPLPAIDPKFGTPILVGGDAFVMLSDTPATREFMEYIATPEPHRIWAQLGGFISPHQQVSLEAYPDEVSQKIAQILLEAEVVRFDASDTMPEAVRQKFWRGMVDFAAGTSSEEVTQSIESP